MWTYVQNYRINTDMYPRTCNPLKSQSFFLFGARGTGKSTLLKSLFKNEKLLWLDFLTEKDEARFSLNPDELFDIVTHQTTPYDWVVADEIQKVPKLLDVVHRIIETNEVQTKFALTGSSARKLKKGASNLLAGRAFTNNMYPLTFRELEANFAIDQALNWGTLPKIFALKEVEEKKEFLRSYTSTYLKEEIWSEQVVKNLTPFRKFIEMASQMSSEILNYSKIATQIGADSKTVQKYFLVLEDTLLGFHLEAFHTSVRKQIITSPKFYIFDIGIKRAFDKTLNLEQLPGSYYYGKSFEHFILSQMIALNSYGKKDYSFYYLKTKDGAEVDLIVQRPGLPLALIEIKSAKKVEDVHFSVLRNFKQALAPAEAFCFSQDPFERTIEGVQFLPWQKGIAEIGL